MPNQNIIAQIHAIFCVCDPWSKALNLYQIYFDFVKNALFSGGLRDRARRNSNQDFLKTFFSI